MSLEINRKSQNLLSVVCITSIASCSLLPSLLISSFHHSQCAQKRVTSLVRSFVPHSFLCRFFFQERMESMFSYIFIRFVSDALFQCVSHTFVQKRLTDLSFVFVYRREKRLVDYERLSQTNKLP